MVIEEITKQYPDTKDYVFKEGDVVFEIDGYLIICEEFTSNIVCCSFKEHKNSLKHDVLLIWNELKRLGKQYIRIHPASRWRTVFKMFPAFNDYCIDGEYMYLKLYGDNNE